MIWFLSILLDFKILFVCAIWRYIWANKRVSSPVLQHRKTRQVPRLEWHLIPISLTNYTRDTPNQKPKPPTSRAVRYSLLFFLEEHPLILEAYHAESIACLNNDIDPIPTPFSIKTTKLPKFFHFAKNGGHYVSTSTLYGFSYNIFLNNSNTLLFDQSLIKTWQKENQAL